MINRAMKYYKKNGFLKTIKRLFSSEDKIEILKHFEFIYDMNEIPFNIEDLKKLNEDEIILNWIIPEMGIGSGGHINIFRFISYLEQNGIHNRVYLFNPPTIKDDKKLLEFVREHFQILDKKVELFSNINDIKFAHGTVATAWQTAYFVKNFNNTISKFYFIQDFEPYFYAHGSEYHFAENTYNFNFRGLTAGDWLKDVCSKEYGMKCDSFGFSYEKELYKPKEKKDDIKRVFFYARPVTPRRDFELGLISLKLLSERIENLEVVFAGWDVKYFDIPFKHQNLKIVNIEDLCDVYSQCDMCLVISSTNLSLLPLEVMASNSVAVCSVGENSEWLINKDNSVLVDFDPVDIANKMEYYLNNESELSKVRNKGLEFAQKTSWESEGKKVLEAIKKGIKEDAKK